MAREDAAEPVEVEAFYVDDVEFVLFEMPAACSNLPKLTDAEAQVVSMLLAGKRIADVASMREVSYRTVANQLASVYRKLQVTSAAELMARLLEQNVPG